MPDLMAAGQGNNDPRDLTRMMGVRPGSGSAGRGQPQHWPGSPGRPGGGSASGQKALSLVKIFLSYWKYNSETFLMVYVEMYNVQDQIFQKISF